MTFIVVAYRFDPNDPLDRRQARRYDPGMETVDAARAQFDRQAHRYNETWAAWSDETLRRMLELAEPQPHWDALDIATGGGFTAIAFAPRVASVVGTDIAPKMLEQASLRANSAGIANVRWVEAPAESLPMGDASFDLVTVRIAPHHFVDVPAFLREVNRVLRPGGVFVLGDTSVPDDDPEAAAWQNAAEKERDTSHQANLSPRVWAALTDAAGLAVEVCEYVPAAIPIQLDAWIETAGCDSERAARVRERFATAPESARRHFQIDGARFAWPRVILKASRTSPARP